MNTDLAMGRALAMTKRHTLFDDPRWEERFEVLIRLTQRTQLIQSLTGTDASAKRIKYAIDKQIDEMGIVISRPRGLGQSYSSKGFLSLQVEKYDATYLMNLHFGANGPGSTAQAETNLGAALDKRIEVYLRYRSDLYENADDARVSFETYVVLIEGLKNRGVSVHKCKECSSRYVWTLASVVQPTCPVCATHQHSLAASTQKLQFLYDQQQSHFDKRETGTS